MMIVGCEAEAHATWIVVESPVAEPENESSIIKRSGMPYEVITCDQVVHRMRVQKHCHQRIRE